MMLMMAQRPEPIAMLNHRGERMMSLPYYTKPMGQAKKKTRKLSVMEDHKDDYYEHVEHLTKKQRSDNNIEPELASFATLFTRQEENREKNSPFELHLQAIYQGNTEDGVHFFESHGYYDITDANTVAMFRQNFGLGDEFWLEKEDANDMTAKHLMVHSTTTSSPAVYPFGSNQEIMSSRSLLRRECSHSGRFMLLDDDGNEVDEHTLWEMEREDRLKAKSLELDDDELAELERDQVVLVQAITVIRSEKSQLQQLFMQSSDDEESLAVHSPSPVLRQTQRPEVPMAIPQVDLELPPYCGYVNLLKDTIPFLMRSWHKRWFYLDFQAGVVLMYKRSYWKSPRGVVDLRNVAHIEKMSQGDFRIEFHNTGANAPSMMLMRSKLPEEAELWVNLLRFAKQASRGAPRLIGSLMDNTKAIMKKVNKKNQVDILAQIMTNSANSAGSTNLRAIAQASAVAASAVSNRRGSTRH
ncbi:unnamed protein product [Peronospora belbahrii]|uniref:PH domain-containing protein n=1 Tax=Peronospora belbahrii TaxID=622444 RepID=A0AAU9KSJ9_9STRA|nr:unnamed protein product [Peronospora belbahrii]CAH0521523.1 unnamed protein product [Peronospora belbahrii]